LRIGLSNIREEASIYKL